MQKKLNWLEKIRAKSDKQKKMISPGISFCFTAIIFAVWLLNFVNLGSGQAENFAENQTSASPIAATKEFLKNTFELGNFGNLGKETYDNN